MKLGATETIKFKKLKMRLKISHWQAVGLLESLWLFTSRNAPIGDIGRHPNDDIAAAIEWAGDPDELINTLVECKWLDVSEEHRLVVHDWADHMPNWLNGSLARHNKKALNKDQQNKNKESAEATPEPPAEFASENKEQPASEDSSEQSSLPFHSLPSHSNSHLNENHKNDSLSDKAPDLVAEFVDAWNSTSGVVRIIRITDARRKMISTRLRDKHWDWRSALSKFPLQWFSGGDWTPDIDFFCRPDTALKIVEGKYDGRKSNGSANGANKPKDQFERSLDALSRFARSDEGGVFEGDGPPLRLETDGQLY